MGRSQRRHYYGISSNGGGSVSGKIWKSTMTWLFQRPHHRFEHRNDTRSSAVYDIGIAWSNRSLTIGAGGCLLCLSTHACPVNVQQLYYVFVGYSPLHYSHYHNYLKMYPPLFRCTRYTPALSTHQPPFDGRSLLSSGLDRWFWQGGGAGETAGPPRVKRGVRGAAPGAKTHLPNQRCEILL